MQRGSFAANFWDFRAALGDKIVYLVKRWIIPADYILDAERFVGTQITSNIHRIIQMECGDKIYIDNLIKFWKEHHVEH